MAQINVNELMHDPDFTDQIILINRTTQINSYGENLIQEVSTQTYGSVQPATGKVINRLPEALRVADLRSFWIKGTITATAPGQYTDILVFKCQRYQVQTVQDWSNFGEGFSEGTCVMEKPTL